MKHPIKAILCLRITATSIQNMSLVGAGMDSNPITAIFADIPHAELKPMTFYFQLIVFSKSI